MIEFMPKFQAHFENSFHWFNNLGREARAVLAYPICPFTCPKFSYKTLSTLQVSLRDPYQQLFVDDDSVWAEELSHEMRRNAPTLQNLHEYLLWCYADATRSRGGDRQGGGQSGFESQKVEVEAQKARQYLL